MSYGQIKTLADYRTVIGNSGVYEWEWQGNANLDGFISYAYNYSHNLDTDEGFNESVSDYLVHVGENPKDYF
jgi:hypothetical protein